MNLRIHELVIFNQTTKIDTHEEKYFHSNIVLKKKWISDPETIGKEIPKSTVISVIKDSPDVFPISLEM